MSPATIRRNLVTGGTLLVLALLFAAPQVCLAQAADGAGEPGRVQPPQVLVEQGLLLEQLGGAADRAEQGWAEVSKAIKPTPWPEAPPPEAAGLLPREAAELIEQSDAAAQAGHAYRAVELLQQAEELAPGHPELIRALGLAYAESGNLTRAAQYLQQSVQTRRDDHDALLLLARHAAQSGAAEDALMYSRALEQAGAPAVADYYRAAALAKQGYLAAASDRLSLALEALGEIEVDQRREQGQASELLLREWAVLKQSTPQLRMRRGDWLLQAGKFDQAAAAYQSVELDDPAGRHALFARKVYLALVAEQPDLAVDQAMALLQSADTTEADAQLVDYLLDHGVPAATLAQRLDAVLQAQGVTLPRLIALSKVVDQQRLLDPIGRWLLAEQASPGRLAQAVALLRFDDGEPADAKPLADLLVLVAGLMQRSPSEASDYARATVGVLDAPVTLLRAIRSEAFTSVDEAERRLLAAVAYDYTGRARDALDAYEALLASDAAVSDQVRIPAVRLQLFLDQGEQAHQAMGEPDIDSPWPEFELAVRAMVAADKHQGAIALVDQRIKARGKQLHLDVLRIEVTAQMGQPQQACNLLLRLISSHPDEAFLYRLGIDLAYDYRLDFNRLEDADRMRLAFLNRMVSNLPDAPLSRISAAQSLRANPARVGEAEVLLLEVLQEQPESTGVLSLLVDFYDEQGNEDAAAIMFDRYTQAIPPSVGRSILIADRAIDTGDHPRAVQVLDQALALEQEGVMPGPALTGDRASSLLHFIELADEQRDTDALYVAMLRRFPDHAGLNNALGYRWVVENKNLRQAKAMIQRALKEDPANHSILDSLAWVQYKLGEFDDAQATQRLALARLESLLDPRIGQLNERDNDYAATIAVLNDHMGDILYKRGETDEALEHWRVAQKQAYTEEQMRHDPELRTLDGRLKAKIAALAANEPAPVAEVPGPESHGPAGHPADQEPGE